MIIARMHIWMYMQSGLMPVLMYSMQLLLYDTSAQQHTLQKILGPQCLLFSQIMACLIVTHQLQLIMA